jgi:hypothetical protein
VTPGEAELATEVPAAFVAFTVKVYERPFVRPVITQVSVPAVVHVLPAPTAVAVYAVIGDPPSVAGASHEIVT